MDDIELCYLPATKAKKFIIQKKISPVELMDAVLKRIARLDKRVNAFSHLAGDEAAHQARIAEDMLMSGENLGPLHGIPITIKDLASVSGMPFQRGSLIDAGNIVDFDEPLVERLKAAGAIVIGKTTTSEFGWKGVSQSPLTGITHNPWKYGYNAGASSAGAGAAAASGFGLLHHGGDGAGSIRMPSHFCGVFGIKPTFGRIPNVPVKVNDQVSHHGPLTRTVADAALMLRIMSGQSPMDHYSLQYKMEHYSEESTVDLTGLRVAYSPDLGHAAVDPDVAALIEKATRVFIELGAIVEEVKVPWAIDGPELIRFFWAADHIRFKPYLDRWGDQMDPGLIACIRAAGDPTYEKYLEMRQRKLDYVMRIHSWFRDWDLLLTPAVSVSAFPAEKLQPDHWSQHDWDWIQWAEFSYPFNFSHNPAASVPCGFTAEGLPVGLQVVGRRFEDLAVLKACSAFEVAKPWAGETPF